MAYAISITLDVVPAGENFVIKTLACYNFFLILLYAHFIWAWNFPSETQTDLLGLGGGGGGVFCFVLSFLRAGWSLVSSGKQNLR